jgi:hypothetical protein
MYAVVFMPGDFPLDQVNHVFGDVRGVVGDALNVAGC